MRRLQKRKIQQRVYSWPVVIILTIVAFFFVTNTWDVYKKYSESRRNLAGLVESLEESEMRERELQAKIDYLNSERGLEEEIREKFNVAKEGEEVIVIVDSEDSDPEVEVPQENVVQKLWERVLDVFR